MTLLNAERVLLRLNTGSGELVLTTHRVLHGSQAEFTSLMLEDVGSVMVARMTHRWLLAVTGACIAMASYLVWTVMQDNGSVPVEYYQRTASALLFVSAFLVIAFNVTRFTKVQFASPGATIEFRIRTMIQKEVSRFVREMENAKNTRFLQADGPAEPRSGEAPPQRLSISPSRPRRIG